jgi:hypothetical protein
MVPIRFDFIFSYWILLWFLFYYFNYTEYCPNSWLILGIINNFFTILLKIYYNNPLSSIFIFSIIIFITKVIPLYLLRKKPFRTKDFLFGFFIFMVFSLWLYLHNTNFIDITNEMKKSIEEKKIITPIEYYITKYLKINKIAI